MNIGSVLTIATSGLLKNAHSVQESAERIVEHRAFIVSNENSDSGADTVIVPDDTTLIAEVFNIKKAEIAYSANAQVIHTADSMSDKLLKIMA